MSGSDALGGEGLMFLHEHPAHADIALVVVAHSLTGEMRVGPLHVPAGAFAADLGQFLKAPPHMQLTNPLQRNVRDLAQELTLIENRLWSALSASKNTALL